jgi:superfamily II DNA or RNA helicase
MECSTAWWPARAEAVRVLDTERLWGVEVATVALSSSARIERVPAAELAPLADRTWSQAEVAWRAASGLVLRALSAGEPIAIATGRLEPLPHQLAVLERAMATDPLRLLLADEVGLGKTIEAGMVMAELKAHGLVKRTLIVAPKGVQLQWVAEMADRFDEEVVLVGAGGVPLDVGIDPWRAFDQVVCSLDAIKPLRVRPGWSAEQVATHNEGRIQAVVQAGWDLVIIDEAHHVAGSSEEVARHRLGRALAQAAPRLLLLSATPHSGKSEAFARLLGLLDKRFGQGRPLGRAEVAPLVVRTEKRGATDAAGRPLFKPRTTKLVTVPYGTREVEQALYEAVTDYVRNGYARAVAEHRPAIGFLVLLMQRLVSSSTAAIAVTLERRLVALSAQEARQATLDESLGRRAVGGGPASRAGLGERASDWAELSGEEQQALLADVDGDGWDEERAEVAALMDLARRAGAAGIDAKARHLLGLLGRLASEEGDPGAKAVVFTEFLPTQAMLLDVLAGAGIPAVGVNGSMTIDERRRSQECFRDRARVLVSTDAGGEGVNLQFAHVVVNYDLPWSPTRIEQRIGRVDRIGQEHDVVAHNLVLEASVDARVLAVLEEKLAVILAELGADKAGDVLASTDTGIDDIYATAILDPTSLPGAMEALDRRTRAAVREAEPLREAMGDCQPPGPPSRPSELRRWLAMADGARRRLGMAPTGPVPQLPEVLPGEPVPLIAGPTAGWWTMWEATGGTGRAAFALFIADNGAIRPDLAERCWVALAQQAEPLADPVRSSDLVAAGGSTPPRQGPMDDVMAAPLQDPPVAADRRHDPARPSAHQPGPTLDHTSFDRLRSAAVDHGYRQPDIGAPCLALHLAVRVEP